MCRTTPRPTRGSRHLRTQERGRCACDVPNPAMRRRGDGRSHPRSRSAIAAADGRSTKAFYPEAEIPFAGRELTMLRAISDNLIVTTHDLTREPLSARIPGLARDERRPLLVFRRSFHRVASKAIDKLGLTKSAPVVWFRQFIIKVRLMLAWFAPSGPPSPAGAAIGAARRAIAERPVSARVKADRTQIVVVLI
jgi:hypothetical protein